MHPHVPAMLRLEDLITSGELQPGDRDLKLGSAGVVNHRQLSPIRPSAVVNRTTG